MRQRSIYPVKVDPFLLVLMGRAWDANRHQPDFFRVFNYNELNTCCLKKNK